MNLAIVGATGSGKSSLINLLCRFYDIDQGTITIDGIDIRTLQQQSLRSHIALVLQDVFLFSRSVGGDIRPVVDNYFHLSILPEIH